MYNSLTKKVNSLIFGRSIVHMIEKNLSLKNQKVIFYLSAPFLRSYHIIVRALFVLITRK